MNNAVNEVACALCSANGGELVWEDALCRVVLAGDPDGRVFPGYCRVVWKRQVVSPDKVNLASLGNVVAHLHWHIIPRWENDSHFPAPIWATARRPVTTRRPFTTGELRNALVEALGEERGGGVS